MDWSQRIGRRLKPRDLHVFLAVTEHGNMAKAADALAISRPVVSKTIAGLEQTLGVRLFDRSPQGIEPTVYGRALLRRSMAIFDELRQSVSDIAFLADPTAGDLRVGCPEVMAAGFVAAVINRMAVRYPKLVFHTELGTVDSLQVHTLRERKCELVIGRTIATPAPDMNVEPLFHEQLFVVTGLRNKWASRRNVALTHLLDERWILAPAELGPDGPVAEALQAAGRGLPSGIIWSNSLNLRHALLATGQFVTAIPGSVLRLGPHHGLLKVLPIDLPRWRLPIAIITLKNRTLSPVAELFIEHARGLSKPLAKDDQRRTR